MSGRKRTDSSSRPEKYASRRTAQNSCSTGSFNPALDVSGAHQAQSHLSGWALHVQLDQDSIGQQGRQHDVQLGEAIRTLRNQDQIGVLTAVDAWVDRRAMVDDLFISATPEADWFRWKTIPSNAIDL
jgi:hypothetical protein